MKAQEHRNGGRGSLYWVLVVVGLIAIVVRQWQINGSLDRENQRLQEQLRAFEDTKSENTELQSECERLRRFQDSEAQKIQVLRAEVQTMRQRTNESDRTRLIQKRGLEDAEAISTLLTEVFQSRAPVRDAQRRVVRRIKDREEMNKLPVTPRGGWLGLNDVRNVLGENNARGVFIGAVVPNGPAEKAKIQPGDLLLTLDGQAISGMSDLNEALARTAAGQEIALEVARLNSMGQELVWRIGVVLSDWPTNPPPSPYE